MSLDIPQAIIMIIDDEPDNLNVLGEILRQEGWAVRAFPRGESALLAAHEEPPDLVLLDIRMPSLDGYEVCRRFKADDALSQIPVIFLSAFTESEDKLRAFEAGGVDYVTKPFAESEVLARTRTHLRLRRHQLHLEELVRQRVRELAEANRRLRIWDDAKNQWLNTLSHEMRTPLTGVFGITELLFMELPPSSGNHGLRETYDHSRCRINKLIDDALTLVQIDVASDRLIGTSALLADLLKSSLAALAGQSAECEVRAALDAAEKVTVSGDAGLLTRAFSDLLLTAACCASAGEPLSLETYVSEGQAHVVISTGGQSLPPSSLETFFEVGGQRTLLKCGGDFGLGAALAYRILRLFNGRVSVCNGSAKGLVMDCSLPVA